MSASLYALLKRDIVLAWRAGNGLFTGILFFLAVVVVVPFGVGPDLELLSRIGPAMLWIGALMASLLGLERLFQIDNEDGSLASLKMSNLPLPLVVFAKCIAHWLVNCVPLILATPLFGLLLNVSPKATGATILTLLVGLPGITFVGAVGAALIVSLARGGLLLAVLILPFCIPILIFGVSAVYGAVNDPAPFTAPFLILCAISLVFAVLGPIAAATILKQSSN